MNESNVGLIGLGNVGSKIAKNILRGNFKLNVYDLDKDKFISLKRRGAIWCNSLKTLAKQSSIIITSLPSPKSTNKVIKDIMPFLNKKHLWIEMSTTDENVMKELSKLCFKKKIETLEAPLTGGVHRAETGNIAILAAGKRKNFNRAFPVLSEIGYEILYCGKMGNASTLKVVSNFLASIHLLSLGDALMVCKKYGIDLKTAYHGIKISSGNSFVHETESQLILNGSYDVGFTMDLVFKDVGLFSKLAKKFNIPSDISKILVKKFKEGRKKYGDRAFSTSIVKMLEEKCKENLRAKSFPKKLIDINPKKKGIKILI